MTFQYVSTRGQAPVLDFAGAALAGMAADGGLYVPDFKPIVSARDCADLYGKSYAETAWRVIAPFVAGSIGEEALEDILEAAYAVFDDPEIAPLKKLEDGFYVQELFHGPTLAFKDIALQFLGKVFDYILAQKKTRVTIVGATSGDTGSAAIEAFKGKDNADIVILHPKGRISEVQRRQMTTVDAPNVFNLAIEGSFDDCQSLVKALFRDQAFCADMRLSAVNSINWARIVAQAVYYFYAGVRVQKETGRAPAFSVPTGNFGNVYAGSLARDMGLPVEKLIVATNANDILSRFFTTGRMVAGDVVPTLSPSMDIQSASNFERLFFALAGRQGEAVGQTIEHFGKGGAFHVQENTLRQVQDVFATGRLDDTQTLEVMRDTAKRYNYTVDPHTAIGIGAGQAYRKNNPGSVVVALATAHPAKFPDAVEKATGHRPALPPRLADLLTRTERCHTLPVDLAKVQDFIKKNVRS